jgi:hypothetical protein
MKLRVWWIPQVPMSPFYVPVNNLDEAKLILDSFALYDLFQYENKVKPDYCNAGGLQYFDDDEKDWNDWYDEENGCDFDEYCELKNINKIDDIRKENEKTLS